MKILLVGEYSRLHNSLQEGLRHLGHEVTLIATGDFFKNYPADIKLERRFDQGISKKLKVGLYKLFRTDLTALSLKRQFFQHAEQLNGFDVVQLINESPFATTPKVETTIISYLKQHNQKLFLLSCGTDHLSVSYAMSDALPYSILQGYKDGTVAKERYKYILKYTWPEYKTLHEFVFNSVERIIASDMDYHLPLKEHPKYSGLIPNPVNLTKLPYLDMPSEGPIVIFLGINRNNYHFKGIRYFEEALELLQKKHSEAIALKIVENVPYTEYIESYNQAHIVLDQVFSYDQGYNALEAMAKGKVVFTGAETEFYAFYNLQDQVAVNAVPNASKIAEALSDLIENRGKIEAISKNARAFVTKHHDYIEVAKQYLEVWNGTER